MYFRGSPYGRVFVSFFVFFLVLIPVRVSAHGAGFSVEESVDGYVVDVGISDEFPIAGQLTRFDFALIDEEENTDVSFTDVWFRINQDRKVFLAGGVHRPELGPTGISYVFPEAGEYQINVRYQNEGEKLVEHSFILTVVLSEEDAGGESSEMPRMILITLVTFGVGIGAGSVLFRK